MDVIRQESSRGTALLISGRLDAYWADYLAAALEEALRSGARRIQLDLAQVSFMSSVGIRVLLRFHKQLHGIGGALLVVNPSTAVRTVIDLAGLGELLLLAAPDAASVVSAVAPHATLRRAEGEFRSFALEPGGTLRCTVLGQPQLLEAPSAAVGSQRIRCAAPEFGLGVGAFGRDFTDCRDRFGEFLFAGGAAAYLPTDGSNVADYIVHTGSLVAEIETLYALCCTGTFAHLMQFEAHQAAAPVATSTIIEASLEVAGAETIGVVMVAESAGLIGAALRRSPASTPPRPTFEHPGIRDWLSFTPERIHARAMALITGVVSRRPPAALAPFLRPIGGAQGHLHAACFTYHPLPAEGIDLSSTVASLCAQEELQGVLHLVHDDRPIVGAGESSFWRGAVWVGPIGEVAG